MSQDHHGMQLPQVGCSGAEDAVRSAMTRPLSDMTDLAKKINSISSISLWRAAGRENAGSKREMMAKNSRTSPRAPSWDALSGPKGQRHVFHGED